MIEIKKSMLTMGSIFCLFVLISISHQPLIADETVTEQVKSPLVENQIIEDDPPGWANAEFNGTWGVVIGGESAEKLGTIEGYMKTMRRFGVIEGELPTSQNEYNYYINGITISYFILGLLIINNNTTFYIGFGNFNEDGTFYYNLHLFIDTTWYIEGTWREINIK